MTASTLFDLSGAVALVTGASSGLGRRFARVLAENGASVVLVARRQERLEALAVEIEAKGGKALPVVADMVKRTEIAKAFDDAQAKFGPVTVLVNNAGIAKPQSFLGMREETWRQT
ncbi:MAG: SDR family NAD(P)-dependent oxidoreductase, partial [Hyphomicrobiales bacterium]|nr:SDR family NAD(P)-dependent oxidoreductase [Hyphomicrobiales bacterium]